MPQSSGPVKHFLFNDFIIKSAQNLSLHRSGNRRCSQYRRPARSTPETTRSGSCRLVGLQPSR